MLRRLSALLLATAMATGLSQPANAATSGTLFGALVSPTGGETFAAALAGEDARYGRMPISRVFNPGPVKPWPGNAGMSKRPVVVSFKYAPRDVIAGTYDRGLRAFFAGAPRSYDVFWSYIHEPEDNIARHEFTAADYRTAWQHIAGLAKAAAGGNNHLRSTLILMCYTMNAASGRNWHDYYVASAQSMLSFDCYNHAGKKNLYGDPATIFKPITTWAAANRSIAWGVSEVGSTLSSTDPAGANRAVWLRGVGAFLARQHAARRSAAIFGIYFDTVGPSGTDYRLTDSRSKAAWRDVVQNY